MRAIILTTTTKFFLAAAITHFQSAGNHNTNKKSVAAFVQSFHFVLPAYITGYHHHHHHSHHHHLYRHRHRRPSRSVNEGKERRQSSLIQSYNRCYSSSNNNDRSLELVTQQTISDVTSTSKCHIKTKTNNSNSNNNNNNNWLVVGDGDLSYSSSIASDLANKNYTLFATVLEEEIDHNRIYKRSQKNTADIRSYYENNIYDDNMNLNNKSMMVPSQSFSSSFCLQHQVVFGIDATRLEDYDFSSFTGSSSTSSASTTASSEITTKFHKIEFNFPHWRGKTNNKWNRKLIHEFLRSACNVLQENDNDDDDDDVSEIIISLCEGQGGLGPASNIQKWKQSWLVPAYAAEHGLLLQKLEQPFLPSYTQTSHRGKDRPWIKDGTAQRYHFRFPSSSYNWKKKKYILCPIPKSLQISCRHELRVVLPRESDFNNNNNVVEQQDSNNHNDYYNISTTRRDESNKPKPCRNDIIDGDAVYNLVNEFVPDGIRMDVVTREFVSPYNYTTTISTKVNGTVATATSTSSLTTSCTKTITRTGILAVFLINYSGESLPLTRNLADSIRSQVERSVQERWQLDIRKGGLPVSKPFPTQLLSTLIKDFK